MHKITFVEDDVRKKLTKFFGPLGHPWGTWGQYLKKPSIKDLKNDVSWSYRPQITILY